MKWVCPVCGRFYSQEQVRDEHVPLCFLCGCALKQWSEGPNFFFIVSGIILFPLLGYFAVGCIRVIGLSSPLVNAVAYFIFPSFVFLLNLIKFAVGCSKGNAMLTRGGAQGLLMVLGFSISTLIIWISGYYGDIIGM